MKRTSLALAGLAFAVTLCACSDDNGSPTTLTIAKTSTNSGDAQSGAAGVALANPLRVVVTENGGVKSGVTVTWTTANGGTLTPGGATDASGVATATWTLGPAGGPQTAAATLSGAIGSPVTFTATSGAVATITVAPGGAQTFSPATITINAGESVLFVWAAGATGHNVTPDVGNDTALPASPGLPALLNAPQSFSATFGSAGIFRFFCAAHGANPSPGTVTGMSGTVTVTGGP